jgi:mono/diheme cytochrome c family protein
MATGSCVPPTDPFKLPPQCSTGTSWTDGDRGDKTMHPGKACIACHSSRKGPTFQIAGTVYQTGHEPDDCVGGPAMGSATVEVTDAAGMVVTITPNSSGNFSSRTALKLPYTAKVKFAGRERVMSGAQMSGDCNSCHTQTGTNYAPGRIVLP